jgi:plastocyanin
LVRQADQRANEAPESRPKTGVDRCLVRQADQRANRWGGTDVRIDVGASDGGGAVLDRRLWTRIVGALGGAALVAAIAAGSVLAATTDVGIAGFSFSPKSVTINVGDTVTWDNSDAQHHTATADDGSFDTGPISSGTPKSVKFSTAGTFAYHCSIHPTMTATLVVKAAAGGTPPATDTVVAPSTAVRSATPIDGLIAPAALAVAWLIGFRAIRRRVAAER